MKEKNQYWQVIRGICILAVVAIHCPQGTEGGGLFTWLVIRQVINFPVALFIFMAGYFVNPDKVNFVWLKNRGGRLLIPFIIWGIIYTAKNAVFGTSSMKALLFKFVIGNAAAPLYYILVLVQLTLITPLLTKNRKMWLYLITPVYLMVLYAFNIITGNMPFLYETLFPAWFVFYLLGMDARDRKFSKYKIKLWMIGLALLLSFVEAAILMKVGCAVGFACSQIKFSSFIYTTLIAMWLSQNVNDIGRNLISDVGDCSFGIFFSHMLFMWVISKVISVMGINIWMIKWSLTFLLTSFTSFGFVYYVRKMFEGKKILRYIGFE